MSDIKVTQSMVNKQVAREEFIKHGDRTTIGIFYLRNGFIIVEDSSCVDPENYNGDIGVAICREKADNKIWELLGYNYCEKLYRSN